MGVMRPGDFTRPFWVAGMYGPAGVPHTRWDARQPRPVAIFARTPCLHASRFKGTSMFEPGADKYGGGTDIMTEALSGMDINDTETPMEDATPEPLVHGQMTAGAVGDALQGRGVGEVGAGLGWQLSLCGKRLAAQAQQALRLVCNANGDRCRWRGLCRGGGAMMQRWPHPPTHLPRPAQLGCQDPLFPPL